AAIPTSAASPRTVGSFVPTASVPSLIFLASSARTCSYGGTFAVGSTPTSGSVSLIVEHPRIRLLTGANGTTSRSGTLQCRGDDLGEVLGAGRQRVHRPPPQVVGLVARDGFGTLRRADEELHVEMPRRHSE